VGKKLEAGQWEVYLALGEDIRIVRSNMTLDGTYQIGVVAATHIGSDLCAVETNSDLESWKSVMKYLAHGFPGAALRRPFYRLCLAAIVVSALSGCASDSVFENCNTLPRPGQGRGGSAARSGEFCAKTQIL